MIVVIITVLNIARGTTAPGIVSKSINKLQMSTKLMFQIVTKLRF